MSSAPLRLYVDAKFTSPYAMAAFVALREKGLDFELRTVNLGALEQHQGGYAQLSVTQRVPTLVHGDLALSESSAITEYLEDCFPTPAIYPQDRVLKAKARQVQAWIRSDLMPIREERSTLVIFYGKRAPALSADGEQAARKLIDAASLLLAGEPACLFGEWSIADVDLAVMLNRLILNGDPVPQPLVDYAERQWQRPAVQEWVGFHRPAI